MTDLVTLHGEYWHTGTVSTVRRGQILLLLPVGGGRRRRRAATRRAWRSGCASWAGHRDRGAPLHLGSTSGSGSPRRCAALADAVRSLRYAEQVIEVLERTGEDGAPGRDARRRADRRRGGGDVRADAAVLDDALLLPQVRAVLDHDAAQGTEYAKTLLTYLGTFGDVVMTAQRLEHPRQHRPLPRASAGRDVRHRPRGR